MVDAFASSAVAALIGIATAATSETRFAPLEVPDYPVLSEEAFAEAMAILDRKAGLTGWDGFDEDLPEGWDELEGE